MNCIASFSVFPYRMLASWFRCEGNRRSFLFLSLALMSSPAVAQRQGRQCWQYRGATFSLAPRCLGIITRPSHCALLAISGTQDRKPRIVTFGVKTREMSSLYNWECRNVSVMSLLETKFSTWRDWLGRHGQIWSGVWVREMWTWSELALRSVGPFW